MQHAEIQKGERAQLACGKTNSKKRGKKAKSKTHHKQCFYGAYGVGARVHMKMHLQHMPIFHKGFPFHFPFCCLTLHRCVMSDAFRESTPHSEPKRPVPRGGSPLLPCRRLEQKIKKEGEAETRRAESRIKRWRAPNSVSALARTDFARCFIICLVARRRTYVSASVGNRGRVRFIIHLFSSCRLSSTSLGFHVPVLDVEATLLRWL